MKYRHGRRWRQVPALALLVLQPAMAADYCAAVADDAPDWFAARLAEARSTLAGGDAAAAYEVLRTAARDLPRVADVSIDPRCVGAPLWGRYLEQLGEVSKVQGRQAEAAGRLADADGAVDWYLRGLRLDDLGRVVKKVKAEPRSLSSTGERLRGAVENYDAMQARNASLLPAETAARNFFQARVDELAVAAREAAARSLADEERVVAGPVTDQERALEAGQAMPGNVAAQFLGDESLLERNEVQRDINRAAASLRTLNQAREWVDWLGPDARAPLLDRARARGEVLLDRGADTGLSLAARDACYTAADDYFRFAGASDRRAVAEAARKAMAPALAAERAEREARLRSRESELRESAEAAQKAMQKSAAEQQQFKKEADEMESELGF